MGVPVETTASTERVSPPRIHLDYLDGIRGLAALFVVFHHVWQHAWSVYHGERLPAWFRTMTVFKFGHYAVDVFIVLSGFCLMLPVARSREGGIPGGLRNFFKRRARRILPPYYAALVISLIALGVAPALRHNDLGVFSMYDPADIGGATAAHLFLIHNLNLNWAYRIDDPLWSVATEWQIYFVFPLLLLPLWRKFGAGAAIALGFTAGYVFTLLTGAQSCLWYIGLFAMGMAGAEVVMREDAGRRHWTGWLALIGWAATAIAVQVSSKHGDRAMPMVDLVAGLATMWTLIFCADRRGRWLAGLFSSRPIAALGLFSYSLYLIHYPLLALAQSRLAGRGLSTTQDFVVLTALTVPALLAVSYLFHVVFERPFMSATVKAGAGGVRRGWRWSRPRVEVPAATADPDAATR
jgi:peptidoglycan/LPS O-acetylase OafA/YrhL